MKKFLFELLVIFVLLLSLGLELPSQSVDNSSLVGSASHFEPMNDSFDAVQSRATSTDDLSRLKEDYVNYFSITERVDLPDKFKMVYPFANVSDVERLKYEGYIVKFKKDPVIEYKTNLENLLVQQKYVGKAVSVFSVQEINQIDSQVRSYRAAIDAEHEAAKTDIKNRLNAPFITDKIKGEYKNTFNGIALDISDQEAEKLKTSPYVQEVYPNYEVKALLMDSVPLIGATDVWKLNASGQPCITYGGSGECLTGKNVTIAIIDTGVDYTHTDLGGCFGTGCKVAGGYDFVNNDNDPMDDHGHGTHVAATAAGNGTLKGVAPDATIYAYKVLSASGSGDSSGIIAAIERSVDPNNDSDFSDHLDIISMSLGGPGTPDDPMSTAVDNAVNNGVVAVIAAGNSGPSQQTIGSPGTARKAITVGATDKYDNIIYFSSRGPVVWNNSFLIKPDVVAPGVGICAAEYDNWLSERRCLDDNHIAISGTSMATPHVAGVAALIRQAHPDWVPDEIKAILKNSAKDLSYEIFAQGYGRVNATKIVTAQNAPPIAEVKTSGLFNKSIDIIGTANGRAFEYFEVYYGVATSNNWNMICNGIIQVNDGVLCSQFDVNRVVDGEYQFRLVVYGTDGQKTEDRIIFKIEFNKIRKPQDKDVYRLGDIIAFNGTISGNNLINYSVEFKPRDGNQWMSNGIVLVNGGTNYIFDNIFAFWNTNGLDEGIYDLRIKINYAHGVAEKYINNVYLDSTIKIGWPVTLSPYYNSHFSLYATVSDLNGDGTKEVVAIAATDRIDNSCTDRCNPHLITSVYVFDSNGNLLSGWPKNLPYHGYSISEPAIADLDNDGKNEIIIVGNPNFDDPNWPDSFVQIFRSDGTQFSGWPRYIKSTSHSYGITLSVGDVDNNGNLEIVVGSGGTFGSSQHCSSNAECGYNGQCMNTRCVYLYSDINVFNSDGSYLNGWPVFLPDFFKPYSTPVIVNLDNNPDKEIVVCSIHAFQPNTYGSRVYAFKHNGTLISGFPYSNTFRWCFTNAAGDINNDGLAEIITQFGIINSTGDLLQWNNPSVNMYSVAVGNVNNDPYLEIAYGDVSGEAFLVDYNGNNLIGWPLKKTYLFADGTPLIADIIDDEKKEIIVPWWSYNANIETGLHVYNLNGTYARGFPKLVGITSITSSIADDIDNDGYLELIGSSRQDTIAKEQKIFVWDLDKQNNNRIDWPMFQHDTQHTGFYTNNIIDIINPVVASSSSVSGSIVTLTATATDNVGVSEVKIYTARGYPQGHDPYVLVKTCTSSPCLYTSGYNNGNYVYYSAARDAAGNSANSVEMVFRVNSKLPSLV